MNTNIDLEESPIQESLRPNGPISTQLMTWSEAMEQAIEEQAPEDAIPLAKVVLQRFPRHLPTYRHLLQAMWHLKRWEEGQDWGLRLLQADPTSVPAWQALAMAAEQRDNRGQAQEIWRRAFEVAPYQPETRAGLSRTSLGKQDALVLNQACLATLYLRGYRWQQAEDAYRRLIQADGRRIDFQIGLMVALWQKQSVEEACALAHQLVQKQRYLLIGWTVLDDIGDDNDKALAKAPITMMDPDREYVCTCLGLEYRRKDQEMLTTLSANADEMKLLKSKS